MRYLVYNVRYSVVPINLLLLSIASYRSVRTTLVYNDIKIPFMMLQSISTVNVPMIAHRC